jgi:PKD repeat protein
MRGVTRVRAVLAGLVAGCLCACAGGHTPASPSPASGGASAPISDVTARLAVRVDGLEAAVTIAGHSEVTFDASGSVGTGTLRYLVSYGDGTSSTEPVSRHVYNEAGLFAVTLTVTTSAGRSASVTQAIAVKSVRGTWFHAGFNANARLFEVRRLTVTDQAGATLRGIYYSSSASTDRTFSGTLGPGRSIRLALDDQTVFFDGSVPAAFDADSGLMDMRVTGGSAGGQTLRFTPVIGEPAGPAPDARLSVRIDSQDAPVAIAYLSPIRYDASASVGERLTHFIEFGDGESALDAMAVHPLQHGTSGNVQARLTVVDRFGRVDLDVRTILVRRFASSAGYVFWTNYIFNSRAGRYESRRLVFDQNGLTLSGYYVHPEGNSSRLTGRLLGERGIELVLEGGGIVFSGEIGFSPSGAYCCNPSMDVLLRGGSADGMTLRFREETY